MKRNSRIIGRPSGGRGNCFSKSGSKYRPIRGGWTTSVRNYLNMLGLEDDVANASVISGPVTPCWHDNRKPYDAVTVGKFSQGCIL